MATFKYLYSTQWNRDVGKTINSIQFQEQILWSLPSLPSQTSWDTPFSLTEEKVTTNTEFKIPHQIQTVVDHILDKGSEFFSQYIAPMLTKNAIDKSITDTLVMTTYYSAISSMTTTSTFTAKASVAMGFKIFASATSPFVAQFVETVTETHLENAKYTYHAIQCLFDSSDCEVLTTLSNPLENENDLFDDVIDFNTAFEGSLDGLSKLTFNGLLSAGIISAAASEFKDFSLEVTHLQDYCSGYFCKNWVAYYYKEFLKQEIKQELTTFLSGNTKEEEKAFTTQAVASKPLSIHDVIDTHSEAPILTPSADINQSSLIVFKPLDVCPPVDPLIS